MSSVEPFPSPFSYSSYALDHFHLDEKSARTCPRQRRTCREGGMHVSPPCAPGMRALAEPCLNTRANRQDSRWEPRQGLDRGIQRGTSAQKPSYCAPKLARKVGSS